MIIIEGTDLVGKTTLCKALCEHDTLLKAGITYSSLSRLPPGFDMLHHHRARMACGLVQDRFHMSEVVYSLAADRVSRLSSEIYRLLDAMVTLHGGIIVIVTADEWLLRERYAANKEREMFSLDVVLRANELFLKIAAIKHVPGQPFDFKVDMHLNCHIEMPFVGEKGIQKIVNLWCERRLAMIYAGERNVVRPLC